MIKSLYIDIGFPHGTMVKNLPATAGDEDPQLQSLGQKDPLEEGMETHSSILAWKNSMGRGAWQATVHGVANSGTQLSN